MLVVGTSAWQRRDLFDADNRFRIAMTYPGEDERIVHILINICTLVRVKAPCFLCIEKFFVQDASAHYVFKS